MGRYAMSAVLNFALLCLGMLWLGGDGVQEDLPEVDMFSLSHVKLHQEQQLRFPRPVWEGTVR